MRTKYDTPAAINYLKDQGVSVSRPTYYRLISDGVLPAVRVGRKWYVEREALDHIGEPSQPQHRPAGFSARAGMIALA